MKKRFSVLLCLALTFFLFPLGSLSEPQPIVRIGIIQHFGKSPSSVLQIKPASAGETLALTFPQSPNASELQEVQTLSLPSVEVKITAFPLNELATGSKKVIAGAYRTYESALYWAQLVRENFPEYNWQIVYPGPWQVWTEAPNPQALMEALYRRNFRSAWIAQKPLVKKVLSWQGGPPVGLKVSPQEQFVFYRSRLLIKNTSGGSIRVNNKLYAGNIELTPDSFGTYSVVNEVPIEEYLRGVVPFEVGADAPRAALETQAILARTYTLANLNRFAPEGYNLCASQDCQVYGGLGSVNKNIDDAIRATAGQVLKVRTGQIAQIFYYSTDGGSSANFDDIWPTRDQQSFKYLTGASTCAKLPDKFNLANENEAHAFLTSGEAKKWGCYDSVSPAFRWEKRVKAAELTDVMNKAKDKWKFAWPAFTQVKDLAVTRRSNTGRATALTVKTDLGEFTIERDEMRAALGGLKSTFFIIDREFGQNGDKNFVFKGAGFGHGVGLSQYGARNLAAQGVPYERILSIYFPNYVLGRV
jgi:SpoIID/LytB domain protein